MRLKSLPEGASFDLQIASSGLVRVVVVDDDELRRFPATRALFEATVEAKLGFSVVIPRSGDHYVIFDNRSGPETRQVRLGVKAEPPPRSRPQAPAPRSAPDRI